MRGPVVPLVYKMAYEMLQWLKGRFQCLISLYVFTFGENDYIYKVEQGSLHVFSSRGTKEELFKRKYFYPFRFVCGFRAMNMENIWPSVS